MIWHHFSSHAQYLPPCQKMEMKMANECVRFEILFSIRFSKLRTKTYKKIDQAKNKTGTYKITTSDLKFKHKIFSTHFIS